MEEQITRITCKCGREVKREFRTTKYCVSCSFNNGSKITLYPNKIQDKKMNICGKCKFVFSPRKKNCPMCIPYRQVL
jgi:hypothetical protein